MLAAFTPSRIRRERSSPSLPIVCREPREAQGAGSPCPLRWRARRSKTTEGLYMKPRITLLTIGVDDLETAVRFYRDGLGLKTEGIVGTEFEYGAVTFFDLQSGLKLALW